MIFRMVGFESKTLNKSDIPTQFMQPDLFIQHNLYQ